MDSYIIYYTFNRNIDDIINNKMIFYYDKINNIKENISFLKEHEDINVMIKSFKEKPSEEEIENIVRKKLKSNVIELFIDLDDTVFDFTGKKEKLKSNEMMYPQSQYGFFATLEPLKDAIDVIKKLINNPKYDVKFATAPSVYNPLSYTEKYISIKEHFGFENTKRLFILTEKDKLDRNAQGFPSILIDDIASGFGQENFNSKITFGKTPYATWKEIEQKLI